MAYVQTLTTILNKIKSKYINMSKSNTNKKLTSVNIEKDLYNRFKFEILKNNFSLQKLVSRAIYLYITDKEFKEKIESQIQLELKSDE